MKTLLKDSIAVLLFITVVSYLVYQIYVYRDLSDDLNNQIEIQRQNRQVLSKENKTLLMYNWYIPFADLKKVSALSLLNKSNLLQDLKYSNKIKGVIGLYIDNEMCFPCLERELGDFKKNIISFSHSEIVILTEGFSKVYLLNEDIFEGLSSYIYTIDKPLFNKIGTPILFYMGKDGGIKIGSYASKTDQDLSNSFFNLLRKIDD